MPKDFGTIDFSKIKEEIEEKILDKLKGLSEEEQAELLSNWERNLDEDIWQIHTNSFGKRILSGYRGDDVNIVFPNEIDGESYQISGISFRKSYIESITISSGVTLIDRLAFAHCEKLKKVTFEDGFTGTIMSSAFMDCSSLEEFAFPSNTIVVEPIVDKCKRLETIYIPNTVRKIAAYALAENESLKNIYFDGTKAQWKAIEKSHYWSYGMGDYTVYCADGRISEKKKKKTNPTIEEKAVVEEAAEYIYCDVKFENTPRKFSYITDDDSIVVGDTVVVPTGRNNIESIGVVCNIQRCTSKNAPFPPTKTKRILRKFII